MKVPTVTYKHKSGEYAVPVNPATGLALVLVPADVLRHLPVSNSWEDIDLVASHNAALRAAVNHIIGDTWRKATTSVKKKELRKVLLENPELIGDLLNQYKKKDASAYDIKNDPDALQLWHFLTQDLAAKFPLALATGKEITPKVVIEVVRSLCNRFRELIEANRLGRLLYNDDGTPRKEKVAQLALFGIADAYCAANDLDLSPEVDSGAGPVDFKVSHGYSDRVTVEVKLSSNSKLTSGFTKQLPLYDKAEKTVHSFYVIIRTTDSDASIKAVKKLHAAAEKVGKRVPGLIIIDGRPTPSASKA